MNVLLSIKPKYVDEILAGKKIFEFRKSIFKKKNIGKVFIYSSSPVKKIVASFEIARIIADSPQKLWNKCQKYGGISENDFFEYFKNSDIGYAIEITNLNEFSEPINPYKLKKDFRPPQSYYYLPLDYFENKSINNISRVKNQDMMVLESDSEYLTNLDDDKNSSKTQRQTKFFDGNESQNMPEKSEKWLKDHMIMKEKVGWVETELGQLCSKVVDGTHHTPEYTETGIPFVSVKDIHYGKVNFDNCKHISYETHEELIKRCCPEPNDLLITKSGTIGRMAIVPNKPEFSLFVSVALLKNYKSVVNTKFLLYSLENYLNSIDISQDIKGGLLKNYHLEDIRVTKIYLAPLPEQRAIVSKIEQLFSELDNGISNLKLAQEQLKVYRQAVLKKAFEGELTKKWREQQMDLPDAGDLLEQIRKEREEGAKISGKRLNKVNPFTEAELAELPMRPKEWTWVKLDFLGDLGRGKSKHRPRNDKALFGGKYPFIQTSEVKAANCTIKSFEKTYSNFGLAQSKLWPKGTLCITIAANIAETAFLGFEGCFPDSIVGFTAIENLVVKEYVYYFFKGNQSKIEAFAPATAQKNINLNILENLLIPFCSLPEQQVIVQEIETRLSVCDKIEQDIKDNLERAEALRQSILKKAFEGKLLNERELAEVRGAEDWEPAEVFLERIREERAKKL